jgi:hypothetical protein
MRDAGMRRVAGVVEQTQRVASRRAADAWPIRDTRAAAPIISVESLIEPVFQDSLLKTRIGSATTKNAIRFTGVPLFGIVSRMRSSTLVPEWGNGEKGRP